MGRTQWHLKPPSHNKENCAEALKKSVVICAQQWQVTPEVATKEMLKSNISRV